MRLLLPILLLLLITLALFAVLIAARPASTPPGAFCVALAWR